MSIYPRKVILDVDAGIDDAWALLLMLKAEQKNLVEIIAITCCHGNAELSEVVDNVCRVLQAFGRKNVSKNKASHSLSGRSDRSTCHLILSGWPKRFTKPLMKVIRQGKQPCVNLGHIICQCVSQ